MKIYNKSAFWFGVFCAGALLIFASGVVSADWWQWIITTAISGRYLYLGLSKTANENVNTVSQHYHKTAVKLYGKYAFFKTNLPVILLIIFFVPALFARFAFDLVTPVEIAVVFCILLTISVAYSIGLEREIKKAILDGEEIDQEKQ